MQSVMMPNRKDGESKNGKNKAEKTVSQTNLLPEGEKTAIESNLNLFQESMHRENTERLNSSRKQSDQTAQRSVDPAKAPIVTEQTLSTSGNMLLYCRYGMSYPTEVSQQSSFQSARPPGEIPALGQQFYKCLIEHFNEEFARKLALVRPDEENFSIWFYNVVDAIGINEKHRTARQQAAILSEIISTFTNNHTVYHTGSSIEGTFASGEEHDYDVIQCQESYPVFEKIEGPVLDINSFLIVREITTPPGYFKLQLLVYGMPCTSSHTSDILSGEKFTHQWCKIDKCGRKVLYGLIHMPDGSPFMYLKKNKPAVKMKNYYGYSVDNNISCRCRQWPTFAQEWITRHRSFGWPTNSMVQQLSSLGFFVVKKGHPLSQETDLEWRASFSLQERELMFSLTDVQYKCYTVLKIFNREIIDSDVITAYHWKTCLFYFIEQNSGSIWKKELLCVCIKLCIGLMLRWVERDFCPNYFIPQENLFAGPLNKSKKVLLERKLEELLRDGFDCLLNVKAGKICDYYRTRESLEDFQLLLSHSKFVLIKELYLSWRSTNDIALDRFNKRILDRYYYYANEEVLLFIKDLWSILNRMHNTDTITEHTTEETKSALSLLLPLVYTCLASNIAVIAIQSTNLQVRDFLLYGSFTYLLKGTLSGKLKFISVLYAIGLYEECEWYLDQLDEEYIKIAPSFCCCRAFKKPIPIDSMNTTQLNVSTCVSFLSSELPITPDALKYEMSRYFGISVTKKERADAYYQWNYRAVVDCNVYFFLLKYVVKKALGKLRECCDPMEGILSLSDGQYIRHRDVAYNLLAWIFVSTFMTTEALYYLKSSWNIMNSMDLGHFLSTKEMKKKQYQFNAAKLHALVVLYNTWFARKSSCLKFCFQCLLSSKELLNVNFKKCSKFKISNYCSKQCQKHNWKIHKVVCKIVNI